jgi:DNA-binding GntR family transcriptional regulator
VSRAEEIRSGGATGKDLCDVLVAALKDRIVHWEFLPGHRLLETDICREYQVSRSPAREALRTLAGDGYVEKLPTRGYRVKHLNVGEARELYDVRMALELFVVETLAGGPPESNLLKELQEIWQEPEVAQTDAETFAGRDREFHETLARLMGNRTLLEQLQNINDRIHLFRAIEFAHPERRVTTREQHNRILEAIGSGNGQRAREALTANIESARNNVEETVKEALARAYSGEGRERL